MRLKRSNIQTLQHGETATALLVVLILVSLISIFALAYFQLMQTERKSAYSFENTQRVKGLAQSGLSHGIELLRANIPEPARLNESSHEAPASLWVINPGRLTVIDGDNEIRHINLHTGAVDEAPEIGPMRDAESFDLNRTLPGNAHPPICHPLDERGKPDPSEEPPVMRVRWQNVIRDPSQPVSKENPMVGRYAFWMDDESGKINFNLAAGKTARGKTDDSHFWEQRDSGIMPPDFSLGGKQIIFNGLEKRPWGLGRVRSINLDVLGDDPEDIQREELLEDAWLFGSRRYPDAIMDFLTVPDPHDWYQREKYNLTFYSRSPEFNAFGRSRFFTSNIPLSLEAGPLYQLPFISGSELNEPGAGVMHFNMMMSELGNFYTPFTWRKDLGYAEAANRVNRARLEDLMGYLRRPWPGYDKSFVDKYGEAECYQIALNILLMGRMATSVRPSSTTDWGSWFWAMHSTDMNFQPPEQERVGEIPEREYWRFEAEDEEKLMLPQNPGPHVTEVALTFRLEPDFSDPGKYLVSYQYQTEYYMHPFGPRIWLYMFPMMVDYLSLSATHGEDKVEQEIGPSEPGTDLPSRDWNHGRSLGRLRNWPGWVQIGPSNGAAPPQTGRKPPNRRVVNSPRRYLTGNDHVVSIGRGDAPAVFDLGADSELKIDFKIRLGMSVYSFQGNPERPRQMIPLGETDKDALSGSLTLNPAHGASKGISFYINDPLLSAHREAWQKMPENEHTLGKANPGEPEEASDQKSKFRTFSRGGGYIQSVGNPNRQFWINKPDEFNTNSVVTSIGYWSMLHTGMQGAAPWRTLSLEPGSEESSDNPPDGLLLDLFGNTYPMQHNQWNRPGGRVLPDQFSTVSFMNSTAGQVNLNTRVYPESEWFQAPQRKKPLEAVFKHLRPDAEIDAFVDEITRYQENGKVFNYIGELAEVPGYSRTEGYQGGSPTQFEREEFLRNMAGCLTTRSNTFGLWGVAQSVTKSIQLGDPEEDDETYGKFTANDRVTAEKRFFALIERYIWPGNDGVPGNAHLDLSGKWDRITDSAAVPLNDNTIGRLFNLPGSPPQRKLRDWRRLHLDVDGTYPVLDGPEEVGLDPFSARIMGKHVWQESSLENAYNPPQPVVKYRVVYFKYLDS